MVLLQLPPPQQWSVMFAPTGHVGA